MFHYFQHVRRSPVDLVQHFWDVWVYWFFPSIETSSILLYSAEAHLWLHAHKNRDLKLVLMENIKKQIQQRQIKAVTLCWIISKVNLCEIWLSEAGELTSSFHDGISAVQRVCFTVWENRLILAPSNWILQGFHKPNDLRQPTNRQACNPPREAKTTNKRAGLTFSPDISSVGIIQSGRRFISQEKVNPTRLMMGRWEWQSAVSGPVYELTRRLPTGFAAAFQVVTYWAVTVETIV